MPIHDQKLVSPTCSVAARTARAALVLLALWAMTVACGPAAREAEPAVEPKPAMRPEPRTVQPGAPGEGSRVVRPGEDARTSERRYTDADVAFMRDMIVHHAQALTMAALVPDRTDRPEVRLLADRIEASQEAEIGLMRRWLEARGEAVVGEEAHAGHHARMMAGMATAEELARLEAVSGDAFDRLFLELMIRHHEGALAMVAELTERGGGQDPEVYMFAGHVDADQRAEIARMRTLQNALIQ